MTQKNATPDQDDIRELFERELLSREANAEKFTCLVWVVLIATTYALFIVVAKNLSPELVRKITGLVCFMIPAFLVLFFLIHRGLYASWMRYVNTFLQVSLVSGAVLFDIQAHGPQYALSSMPPMAYGLVVVVTAFRLRPLMGVFAGLVAALEFALIYGLVAQPSPEMTPELIRSLPSLGWPVTGMKVMVLLALGAACSFAAYRVRNQLFHLIKEAVRQAKLKDSLGRYLSPEVATEVINTDQGRIPSRRVSAIVMFGDVRGFTQFAHNRDSIEVVDLLNNVFATVSGTIAANGGVLNKYLGDGFLAVFGVFGASDDLRQTAINTALAILKETEENLKPYGLDLGIALTRGEVIAGEIGSEGRCEFTVIGDPVNLAARIEGFNRTLGTRLLVPAEFLEELNGFNLKTRSQGSHSIRGVKDCVELVEVYDDTPQGDC